MKYLWVSVNTTCLEPSACNLIELSIALQVGGEVLSQYNWKVKPILHHDDACFGKLSAEKFLEAYHSWLTSTDPRCTLKAYAPIPDGNPLFFYSKDTLNYLGISPESLLNGERLEPLKLLHKLEELLSGEEKKWTLVGHNVEYIGTALENWTKRADWNKSHSKRLHDMIDFKKPIDTLPFFRVLSAFNPAARGGFSLKNLANTYDVPIGMSAESKLEGLMQIVDKAVRGGVKLNEYIPCGALPS